MSLALVEGMCLSGRFRLERCIGVGGMGVVWAATNTNTLRRVALKVLKADSAGDPRVRKRFLREARAASAVRHPNVVEILDVVELEDGSPAMVMELLEGESLATRLRRMKKLDVVEASSVLLPVVSAVGAAHAAGIVHRDLKPDNIFLAHDANGEMVVKVLDFGIAKVSALDHEAGHTEALTGTGTMLGTPYYMSPEQVFADAVIDYRSDIWALGVVLYQCLAGVRPTQAENVGQIMKIVMGGTIVPLERVATELPPEITELVSRMLAFNREGRPQSCREICEVLRAHSDVRVVTFGDPVFVNVVSAPESSGDLGPAIAEATRTVEHEELTATAVDEVATVAVDPKDATQTESKLGVSMSGPAPVAERRRWPTLVAMTALVVVVAGAAAAIGARSQRPSPAPAPVAPAVVAALPSATAESPPIVEAGAERVVPAAVIASAPAPAPPSRRPAPRSSAGVVTTSAPSSPTATTGGLVEKPPF